MSEEINYITVGEIINTQGIRGEVRVWPLTDFPERFEPGKTLILEKKNGEQTGLTVEAVRPHKNFYVIKFREIPDMNTAEQVKGSVLKVPRDQLAVLPEDSFYIFEIIGMEVETAGGLRLGQVEEVIQTGSNDVYLVKGEFKDYMIPAVKEFIKAVDRVGRRITIEPPEGLLEL